MDNLVYRLGIAPSRNGARQLVRHGHITVNGHRVNIPSFGLRPGDSIQVATKSREIPTIKDTVANRRRTEMQEWLEFDDKAMVGRLLQIPTREQIPVPLQEQLIVELYSK